MECSGASLTHLFSSTRPNGIYNLNVRLIRGPFLEQVFIAKYIVACKILLKFRFMSYI